MTSRRDFLLKSSLFTSGLLLSDALWSFTPLAPDQRDTFFDVVIVGGVFRAYQQLWPWDVPIARY
ncbi:hypothetical protein QNH98_00955 [Myroides sp. mNGS23_01]|nr:hypothetical protein [Myroides sp. mNGS23_01]WHT39317.1 hypothetical protein QNH98_00955 [Myroides sp. mNGS23_01]